MDGRTDRQTEGWADRQTDGRMDRWTDGQTDGWMNGGTDGRIRWPFEVSKAIIRPPSNALFYAQFSDKNGKVETV